MIWARRLVIGTGLAVASVVVVPGLAGASTCTTTGSTVQPSMSTPTSCPIVPPTVAASQTTAGTSSLPNTGTTGATSTGSDTTSGTSTLPFTGADVEELAVIGGVALLAGGLLMRRRRSTVKA
jgi:LPXTG-motif cell wall-anchored protein